MNPTDAERTVEAALTERIAREEILPRIDADLIAEHRANPAGPHGDDLQRVLAFLGRRPAAGAAVIVMDPPHGGWAIARLPGERGGSVDLTDERFDTQREAQHAVFLRRLDAFLERYGDGERPGRETGRDADGGGEPASEEETEGEREGERQGDAERDNKTEEGADR